MGSGFTETGLIVFTTLAPIGAAAFVVVALRALFIGSSANKLRQASRCLIIPLGTTVVGLVASATQLGSPANVLNVFNHLGVSPLSNEAFCSALFLLLAGIYWLSSFYNVFPLALGRAWLGFTCLAGVSMIAGISLAYNMYTIPLWNTLYVPLNLLFASIAGGSLLANVTLQVSQRGCPAKLHRTLIGTAAVSFVLETGTCILQNASLAGHANAVVAAVDLVPAYPALIAACALLGGAGTIGVALFSPRRGWKPELISSLSVAAAVIGIFFVRMAFYGLHMTAGF